ncbi:MAG: PQQ-dependent sugar dehydrogenase [Actinobacteria bacterium]|nr:PQQ-dependent sugar dehydrogenase [Actinomycetota bacterium]
MPEVEAGEPREPAATTSSTIAGQIVPIESIEIRTEQVAVLEQPVDLATRPGDDTLYVAEQTGRVQALRPGAKPETVLDLRSEVSGEFEQGLLGLEFTADGAFLYADYTDTEGDTRLVEWAMTASGPDLGSRREVLSVDQPYANHNGGAIEFGPDGFLYVSLGDGGAGGDPHGNAQNLGTLLGKILRIHPRPTEGAPYAVPSSNPFLGREGARGEIWAYGLRNPWRISFDRATSDLWIGDVGQSAVEEVDFQPGSSTGGENYGWDRLEGTKPFEGDPPEDHVLPIHEYPLRSGNCSVTGGYVYRGERIPDLYGVYLFADFCVGQVMGLRQSDGQAVDVSSLGLTVPSLSSFGADEDGELYALSLEGPVYKIVP